MKERPILFSAPMVRALLDGSKTQTRRVCKPADGLSYVVAVQDPNERGQRPPYYTPGWFGDEDGEIQFFCPYGQPGDRLWVRETWRSVPMICLNDGRPSNHIEYAAGRRVLPQGKPPAVWQVPEPTRQKWKPSIHMFRKDSRITLEIIAVRVERLQDINAADALAEGVEQFNPSATSGLPACSAHRYAYEDLWKSINGPNSWDLNPWVWVIEFKRVTA